MQYYRGQHPFANTLAADNMDFADSHSATFAQSALSTQGQSSYLYNISSMNFFRSGVNRKIFPNQLCPGEKNADHFLFQSRLPVPLHNSILGSSLPSYVYPERKIVTYSSIFPCAGRIAFPRIFPWSRPPGEGNRSLPCFGNTSFFPYTR